MISRCVNTLHSLHKKFLIILQTIEKQKKVVFSHLPRLLKLAKLDKKKIFKNRSSHRATGVTLLKGATRPPQITSVITSPYSPFRAIVYSQNHLYLVF